MCPSVPAKTKGYGVLITKTNSYGPMELFSYRIYAYSIISLSICKRKLTVFFGSSSENMLVVVALGWGNQLKCLYMFKLN